MDSELTDAKTLKTLANKKKALDALKSTMGNITAACTAADINRRNFYKWREDDPEFDQAVKDISESAIDMGETALMKQIQDGNTACIIFLLKTRGKHRGYIESTQVEHMGKGGGAIQFANLSDDALDAALKLLENDGE